MSSGACKIRDFKCISENFIYIDGQRSTYLSKWKLMLKEYCTLHARLYNSSSLLEETKLALFTINQTTLVSEYATNLLMSV